jgi:hypothetical protein
MWRGPARWGCRRRGKRGQDEVGSVGYGQSLHVRMGHLLLTGYRMLVVSRGMYRWNEAKRIGDRYYTFFPLKVVAIGTEIPPNHHLAVSRIRLDAHSLWQATISQGPRRSRTWLDRSRILGVQYAQDVRKRVSRATIHNPSIDASLPLSSYSLRLPSKTSSI